LPPLGKAGPKKRKNALPAAPVWRLCTAQTAADATKQKRPARAGILWGAWVLRLPGFPDACAHFGWFVFVYLFYKKTHFL
jgi:hypothetical protein